MPGKTMDETLKMQKFSLREATEYDIPKLSIHHRKMFEEIWKKKGSKISKSGFSEMERAYSQKLNQEMASGLCKAWVIEDRTEIVASGAITVVSFVPMPKDLSPRVAYLHSMYTEKGYRRRDFANRIVNEALQSCKANGIKRVILNASEAGKPVYEKIGFVPWPETMGIFIA